MTRRDLTLITISGLLLILAFAPFPFGFLAYVALIPLFLFIQRNGPGRAFAGGYLAGFLWASGTLYWIGWPTPGGLFGVLLIMPAYCGTFSLLQSWMFRRWGEASFWTAPILWIGLETLSSLGQLAFPWNMLGNTQAPYPVLIQCAEIFGAIGVSFWIVLLNVLLYFGFQNRRSLRRARLAVGAAVFVFVLPLAYGLVAMSRNRPPSESIRVSLVQGSIDAYRKWTPSFIDSNFVLYGQMTLSCATEKPDLVVWPETATPCYLRYRHFYLTWVKSIVDSISVPLLTGSPDVQWLDPDRAKTYNAAFLIKPGSDVIDSYYKKHLVPFSEKVPFSETFPKAYDWLNRIIPDVGDYSRGDSTMVFSFHAQRAESVLFSAVICFESVFPNLVSRFVLRGAEFLIVITNDGWFGNTSGPLQHASIAVLRAIENRRWIVRCANTGISEFVDPFGRVTRRTRYNERAVLTETVGLSAQKTFYTRSADLFLWMILAGNVLILGATLFKRGKSKVGKKFA